MKRRKGNRNTSSGGGNNDAIASELQNVHYQHCYKDEPISTGFYMHNVYKSSTTNNIRLVRYGTTCIGIVPYHIVLYSIVPV